MSHLIQLCFKSLLVQKEIGLLLARL